MSVLMVEEKEQGQFLDLINYNVFVSSLFPHRATFFLPLNNLI